jgi:TonB-dependent SusC/RagA subfamily outer membrane receptor
LRRRVGSLDSTLAFRLRSQPAELQGAQPILLIDDVRADMSALKKIDRTRIATVNVLKGVSAVSLYGPDAKNGVIVVRTKPAGAQ